MLARTLVVTFGLLTAASLSLPYSALVATADAQSRYRFQEMDRNGDGIITRDEWRGSNRSFDVQDRNGDGQLSGNEIRLGARQNSNWEEADHTPNWRERTLSYTQSAFNNLDHNRDGRLTPNEWHYQMETFRRIDRNRDNALNASEFLGQDVDDERDVRFDDLDYNNDGIVSRNEWYGNATEFRRLDRNNDGRLTRFEVVGSENSFDTYDEFNTLDHDRSGTLSRAEWHWSNLSFNQQDANRDGIISPQEFEASGGAPGTAGALAQATQTVTVNSQQRWTDTGITVRAGDVITFRASGQIQMSDNASDTASPAGALSGRTAPDAPVLGAKAGGLLAMIGGNSPMFVGDRTSVTAPVSGRLYLGVNDDHLPDNRGSFTVAVAVQPR